MEQEVSFPWRLLGNAFFHCEFCTWRVSRQGNYYLPPILSYLIHLCDVEMCMLKKKTCIHLMHEIRRDFAFQIHSASWLEIKKKKTINISLLCPRTYSGEGNGNPLQYSSLEKSQGQRNLAGHRPWDLNKLDTTEHLSKKQQDLLSVIYFSDLNLFLPSILQGTIDPFSHAAQSGQLAYPRSHR